MNLLKDVDYWVAVSGGAYISAAYVSHILAEPVPDQATTWSDLDMKQYYLGIVAKTLTRFQKNAGNFIRDPTQIGWRDNLNIRKLFRDDSDWPPRWCDAFFLIVNVLWAIVGNPLMISFVYLIPVGELVILFFGAGLRAAWCT